MTASVKGDYEDLYLISIHTPTKGVTFCDNAGDAGRYDFNPHSHEGSDSKDWQRHRQPGNFNPHSHEGSDSIVWSVRSMRRDFNPHSHEGSDASDLISLVDSVISIHTPTKGVTQRRQ